MSTSLLYHGFGLRGHGYTHRRTEYAGGAVTFHVQRDPASLRCSVCASDQVIHAGTIQRRLRTLPIGRKPVWIELPVQRLSCRSCGLTRQAHEKRGHARLS